MDQKTVTDFTNPVQEPMKTHLHQTTNPSSPPEEHTSESQRVEILHCQDDREGVLAEDDHLALSDGLSDFSNSDFSFPEVCIASNVRRFEEEMNYEVQQAYRIFTEFLSEKHKIITAPFLNPIGNQENQYGIGGVRSRSQANVWQAICLRSMKEKFMDKAYKTITEFVADFRQMLENCYRYHGVDHWLSKQAQKLEIMLEQKLTLLSRKLREKTTLAVTSEGRFAVGEEKVSTSSRRRHTPRCLKTVTVGGHESIMVQTLRVEEQQKAKEEKRLRDLEKKEAEEISAKEIDEWEKNLLSQASPHSVETLWELPAIGHFLCLAQTALNLPEIVFFELERCLLMPRCSILLSKIMSSLLCSPQRRSTLHRRPVMPYRRWESELRQRVKDWYHSIGGSHNQAAQAEQLGLCHQFFNVLGKISPLEAKAFHMLPFYQRVWLLKGLCDHVYETQRDIQAAVLAQPIHECRESILGYDSKENAYIHFPHFCGADLRIYCQSPCTSPTVPFTSVLVKKVQLLPKLENIVSETSDLSEPCLDDKSLIAQMYLQNSIESTVDERSGRCLSCKPRAESNLDPDISSAEITAPFRKRILITNMEGEPTLLELKSKRLKEEEEIDCNEIVKAEHCLSIGEHCYTGRSPAGSVPVSASQKCEFTTHCATQVDQKPSCCKNKISNVTLELYECRCGSMGFSTQLPSDHIHTSCEDTVNDKILTLKKGRKRGKRILSRMKHKSKRLRKGLSQPEVPMSSVLNMSIAIRRKDEKRKRPRGKALSCLKEKKQLQPSFKLVCTNLDDLRELINKIEDELDDLESTKKRLNLWYNRRGAVKDLHSTLIRLLNELMPWEPKLIKAYQRNRLRLKKEFEVFRDHPDYSSFVREESISSSSDDGGLNLLLEQTFRHSGHDDPEHLLPRGLGGTVKAISTELATESAVTHISHNHQTQIPSTVGDDLAHVDTSTSSCKSERSHPLVKSMASNSSLIQSVPLHTALLSKPESFDSASGKLKSYSPIPTLLAKSVGNKVTLMKQPACTLKIDHLNLESRKTVASNNNVSPLKLNVCSFGPPNNSQQKHKQNFENAPKHPGINSVALPFPESLKEFPQVSYTGHMVQNSLSNTTTNTNQKYEDLSPQQVFSLPSHITQKTDDAKFLQSSKDDLRCNSNTVNTMLRLSTNLSDFVIPENRILVQQVPPSNHIDTISSFSDPSFPKTQPSATAVASSKGPQHCSIQSSTSQLITSTPSGSSMFANSKQELRTVCIRESQSILVTTRGGNTGIVRVQKSATQPTCLSKSPVIPISPQFQAYLVPSMTPVFSSNSVGLADATLAVTTDSGQTQKHDQSLKSNFKVTTCVKTTSISLSQEVRQSLNLAKCQVPTGMSDYTSTTNLSKPVTPGSCSPSLLKKCIPSSSNITSPSLSAVDTVIKPHSDKPNEGNRARNDKLLLSCPSSCDDNVCCTETQPQSVTLTSSPTGKGSLPIQGVDGTLKQATVTGPTQQVMKTVASHMLSHSLSSAIPVSLLKDKAVLISPGTTDTSIQVPCLIATSIAQSTAVSPTVILQPAVTNSNVISRGITVPASALKSVKHLDIASISKISQPVNITCPSTNSSSASFKKKHGVSTIMMSSNLNVHPVISQMISKPILIPNTQSKSQNSLFIANASSGFQKISLSPSSPFRKPQISSTVPQSSENAEGNKGSQTPSTNTSSSPKGPVQQQIVISTSIPLPAGAHIVLNNAQFRVPPQGLGPGSHVFLISGNAPQQLSASSTKEVTIPFQEVNQAPFIQSSARLHCVPAIRSPLAACTPIATPSVQATSSIVTATRSACPNNKSLLNNTMTGESCPSLQIVNVGKSTGGASITSVLPITCSVLSRASTVLTSPSTVATSFRSECSSTTTNSLAFSLSSVPPPLSVLHRPPTVNPPFKADPVQITATAPSQGSLSPTHSTKASSQPPRSSIASISCSSSTALMHMGHSSLLVQKQDPTVTQAVSDSGWTMKNDEQAPLSKNGTAAQSQPFQKASTHCPVIMTSSAVEKHLMQTSFLRIQDPVASKMLCNPDGDCLSALK